MAKTKPTKTESSKTSRPKSSNPATVRNSGKRQSPPRREQERDQSVFRALANQDRRYMMDLLKKGPLTTGQLCDQIDWLGRCAVMQHLGVLEEAELIIAKKKGRSRWHYMNCEPIQRIHRRWIKEYAEPAADLLASLKSQLESE